MFFRPATETHEIAERKLKELERLREAWGIKEDAVEGAAFNQELQVCASAGKSLGGSDIMCTSKVWLDYTPPA